MVFTDVSKLTLTIHYLIILELYKGALYLVEANYFPLLEAAVLNYTKQICLFANFTKRTG